MYNVGKKLQRYRLAEAFKRKVCCFPIVSMVLKSAVLPGQTSNA